MTKGKCLGCIWAEICDQGISVLELFFSLNNSLVLCQITNYTFSGPWSSNVVCHCSKPVFQCTMRQCQVTTGLLSTFLFSLWNSFHPVQILTLFYPLEPHKPKFQTPTVHLWRKKRDTWCIYAWIPLYWRGNTEHVYVESVLSDPGLKV